MRKLALWLVLALLLAAPAQVHAMAQDTFVANPGNQSAPAFTFRVAGNPVATGMYLSGQNLVFAVNGARVLEIGSTGIVYGGGSGSGSVTSIATTSPIGGGTITTTGTITCTTCLTATAPTNHGVLLGAGTQAVGATTAGTSGQVLTSNGASADPTFQTISGTGTVTSVATTSPITGGTITGTGTIACATCATANSLTTNRLAKIGTSPALANSLATDDGTTLAYTGTGGVTAPAFATSGAATGTIAISGSGSGTVTQTVQTAAGTPTVTWGTSTGTPAVTASSPLAITTATGNITCATCTTNASALTSGQLVIGGGSNATSVSNLSGDVTTSGTVATTIASGAVTAAKSAAVMTARGIVLEVGSPTGSALTTSDAAYVVVPFKCTVVASDVMIDASDATVSFDIVRAATGGSAIPSSSILTGGFLGVASGTAVHNANTTLFASTAVAQNDRIGLKVHAANTAKYASVMIQCNATD